MKTNLSNPIPKKKNRKKVALIFAVVSAFILLWAGLTKVGFIPNFLDIEILSPKEEPLPFTPMVVI